MDQNKIIKWDISQEHIESQDLLGFKVELSEDEFHKRISFVHNTFNGADNFLYETSGGSFIPYPKAGIDHPIEGREVQLPYESEKLMKFVVVSKNDILYRVSPDGERIIETLDIGPAISRHLSIDDSNNDIWITTTNEIAIIVETPFCKSSVKYVPISKNCLAVIVDGYRKVFWEVTNNELSLKKINGQLVKKWQLLFKADSVLSYQILPATGNIYITIGTTDSFASSERFLIFCEFAGDIFHIDAPNLDEKIGCITKWTYNSVLTGGTGSQIIKWVNNTPTVFADLFSDGAKSVLSISAKEDDTIYLVNENNYLMAFDSSTLIKQWRLRLPGSETRRIQPMFNSLKDGRPILFNNKNYIGKIRDFSTKGIASKSLNLGGGDDVFSVFGSTDKAAVAYVRISATEPIPPESSSISSSSATSISTASSSSSSSSASSSTLSTLSTLSFSSTSFSVSSISSTSSSTQSSKSSSSVDDEWNITILNSSNARIDSYTGTDEDISIPSLFKNVPVTSIATNAFLAKNFTSVSIPNSVVTIGNSSFKNCINLTSLTIPSSVTSIGQSSFEGCVGLSSVSIPGSITTIPYSSFKDCSNITSLTLSEGITYIEASAFSGLSSLTSVSLPDSLTGKGSSIFENCPLLTEILVSVSNLSFSSIDGVLFDKLQTHIHRYPQGKLGVSYTIPSGVTVIESSAFNTCIGLTEIIIPAGVVDLSSYAFYGCSNLENIEVPEGVVSIGGHSFNGCTSLISAIIPNSVTTIDIYAFNNCTSLATINIPAGVTTIGSNAFYNCISLTSLTIPSGVTRINQYTFYNCTGLTSLVIPSGVTQIDSYAFYNLNITNFIIPSGVLSIGTYAFQKSKITSIFIPDGVITIGARAFTECDNLTAIMVGALNINFSDHSGVLYNKTKTTLIQFPGGKSGAYSIPVGCTVISSYAFHNCSLLTSIVIPSGMINISDRAFESCIGINSDIFIPASVTTIGEYAFHCPNLPSITVDSANSYYIDDGGILYNKLKTTLIQCPPAKTGTYAIPIVTTVIGNWAFYQSKLSNVTLPSNLTTISYNAFNNSNLTSIDIPASVTSIGGNAFVNCPYLTDIIVNVANAIYASVDGVLFNYDITNLIHYPKGKASGPYTIPSTVLSIGTYAFYNCTGLTEVIFPYISVNFESSSSYSEDIETSSSSPSSSEYGVKTIGNYAFWNCDGLESVIIPSSVISLGTNCFDTCSNLLSITFNGNAPTLGDTTVFLSMPAKLYYYDWGTGFDSAWMAKAGKTAYLISSLSSSSSST